MSDKELKNVRTDRDVESITIINISAGPEVLLGTIISLHQEILDKSKKTYLNDSDRLIAKKRYFK